MENYLQEELYSLIQSDISIFEFIQNSSLDGIWYWDLENPENEWMSPRFWEVLGYDFRQMKHLVSEWQDIIFQEDLKLAIDNFHKHLKNPDYKYDQIVRYKHKDGSTVWIRCRGVAIRDNNGNAIRMLGAHNDLTPAMNLRNKVKEVDSLHNRLFLAADEALAGYWEWNLDTNYLYLSQGWKRFLGYNDDELESSFNTFSTLLHPDDLEKTMQVVNNYLSNQVGTYNAKFRLKHKNGQYKWVSSIGNISEDNDKIFFGFHIDIDDLTTTKETLIAQSKSAMMGEMISMIAHQWKQPLSTISMISSNVKLDVELGSLNEKDLIESSNEIKVQIDYLTNTINTFRNFLTPNKEEENILINEVINDSLPIVDRSLKNNFIELVKEFRDYTKISLVSSELTQVLLNIINNSKDAFKNIDSSDKKIWIKTYEDDETIFLEIKDNAGGIEIEKIDNIFEPYFTTKEESDGTGIGLYIVKTIIEEHLRGKISAKNHSNGASFLIELAKQNK